MNDSNRHSIGKDAAVLAAAKCITLLISLVTSMLLSRFRTLDEYGTYSQIQTVVTLAISIFTLGLPNCLNYFLSKATTSEQRRDFLSVYYSFSTVLCIAAGTILLAAVPLIEAYYDNSMISSFAYVLAILPWTKVTISGISNVLVVYGRTVKLTVLNIVNALLALAAVMAVKLFGWSFNEYMILYLCAEAVITLWVYIIVYRAEGYLSVKIKWDTVKVIFAYSLPIGLAAMVGTLNVELDKLMIGYFLDTESVAIYSNAGKELPLTLVATSLTAVLLPQMVRKLKAKDNKGAIELWGDTVQLSYMLMAFFVTACIVFAPQIMTILYSEKYLPGVRVFRIYSLVLLLRTTYFGIVLNSVGKTKAIFYCSLISFGLNTVLNYLMFVLIGFEGPALASLLSILAVSVLQLIISSRTVGVAFSEIFPWREIFKITLVNALWGALAYALVRMLSLGTDIAGIAVSIAVGAVITLIYALVLKKRAGILWRRLNADEEKASQDT